MTWQIFADESFDASGWFVLAGYAAPSATWKAFSRDWQEILPFGTLNSNDAERSFHMVEMMKSAERQSRIGAFGRVIERHIKFMVSIRFWIPALAKAQNRLEIPGHKIKTWPAAEECYRLAWNQIMAAFVGNRQTIGDSIPVHEQVEFIFDHHGDARKFMDSWAATDRAYPMLSSLIRKPRFEDDTKEFPLQAADMLAWRVRRTCPPEGKVERLPNLPQLWDDPKPMMFLDMALTEDAMTQMLLEGTADSVPVGTRVFDRKTGASMMGRGLQIE